MKKWILKNKWTLLSVLLLIPFALAISFKQILDKTVKHRTKPIEYLVIHWTANTDEGADASANAYYLRNKRNAGTHYCIDDRDIFQCTEDQNVAYAVGGPLWRGFRPKFWLSGKIFNNNSLSFEMCLGGGREDSLIIDNTADLIGKKLVEYGLDLSRVVRHYDVNGKPCPRFLYSSTEKWNQIREDSAFSEFLKSVDRYYQIQLFRKKIWKERNQWLDTVPPTPGVLLTKFSVK